MHRSKLFLGCFLVGLLGWGMVMASPADTARINEGLRRCYNWQYNAPDSSLLLAPKLFRDSQKANYPLGQGKALYYLGHAHFEQQQYDSAVHYMRLAIPYFDEKTSLSNLAAAYNIKSVCEKHLADYSRSLNSLLTAIKYFEKAKDTAGIIIAYNNFGLLYNAQNKLVHAETWFWKGLKLAALYQQDYLTIVTKSNIGFNLHSQGRYSEALDAFQEVLKYDIEYGSALDIGASYNNIASCYLKQGDYVTALQLIDSSLYFKYQAGDKYGLATSYANKAEALRKLNKASLAKVMLDSAWGYAYSIGAMSIQVDILEKYHLVYLDLKMPNEALAHYKQYHKLSDSILNQETEIALYNVQRQFDLEKIDQELYRKTLQVESYQSRQKLYIAIIGSILIVLIVLIFFSVRIKGLNKSLALQKNQQSATNEILKRVNEQLEIAKNEAESANKAKSAFLSNVSHEIRTPLNAIIGLLDQMHEQLKQNNQHQDILTIQHAANSLLHIINDLLDLSKIEAGKISFENKGFHLQALFQKLQGTLVTLAAHKPIEIITIIDKEIPANIIGDQYRLNQILLNLGSNAVKFTSEGQVSVHAQLLHKTTQEVKIRFEIRDTGIGIAAENQTNVFERFIQVDSNNARKFGGTGLGLAICKKLVELQHGEIGLESALGKGATFWFTLNFKLSKQATTTSLSDQANLPRTKAALESKEILVVDDNMLNLKLAVQILKRLGIQSTTVSSGQEALNQLKNQTFDAILLDIHMPEMNGFDTFQKIREQGITTPIIALTADTFEDTRLEIERFGFEGILLKPYNLAELQELLEGIIK
ncbi:MAG: ATP-binding protein [Sphingobacteriaceae bacterium]|nr:ATP-binding protein [Sphingobacteriaceae bacterium]